MTEPTNGHALITRNALGGRALGRKLDTQASIPRSRAAARRPLISNPDGEGALICMKTQRQVKAVQLLNGGAYIDIGTLDNYADVSEIQALMRAGPIFHLGPERRGFSWSKPNSRRNDHYLISLSLNRQKRPAEGWVYSSTGEMTEHARKLRLDHAYIWTHHPVDKTAPGHWHYMRTNTPRRALIPYDHETRNALDLLRELLEAGPAEKDDPDYHYLEYVSLPPLTNTRHLLDFGSDSHSRLNLVVLHSGEILAVIPQVRRRSQDPADYGEIPLTADETATLTARIADTYPPN